MSRCEEIGCYFDSDCNLNKSSKVWLTFTFYFFVKLSVIVLCTFHLNSLMLVNQPLSFFFFKFSMSFDSRGLDPLAGRVQCDSEDHCCRLGKSWIEIDPPFCYPFLGVELL